MVMRSEPPDHNGLKGSYEIVDHTADWALRVFGSDLADLLRNAAIGMSSLLVVRLSDIPLEVSRDLVLEAFDAETLLVDWLSELAYFAEEEQLVFREYRLWNVTSQRMAARIRGGRAPELQKHIKAVTYHELSIERTDSGVTATIVFDV
jgi:SHS2 domain-containing protein